MAGGLQFLRFTTAGGDGASPVSTGLRFGIIVCTLSVLGLHYNEFVGSRTGRSLVERREESPNSAEQCAG